MPLIGSTGSPSNPDRLPLFGRCLVPLPTGAESAAFDRRAIQELGVPDPVLMENAGRGAALVLERLIPRGRVLVLAGKGNNGGDGVVVARTLHLMGREVRLGVLGRAVDGEGPLLHGHPPRPEPIPEEDGALDALLSWGEVVVDGLLGTGIQGPPRKPEARVIRALNRAGGRVVALDLPSGVDADTGECAGEAVRSHLTVAFGAPKMGSLLHPGRERSGRLVAVDIGLPPWGEGSFGARLITPGWAEVLRPRRALRTHKNREGRLLLLAGASGMGGAAVLAARAALRAGVGFLRVASHGANRDLLQALAPEAVFVDVEDPAGLREAAEASDALACGPGMGTDASAARRLNQLLEEVAPSGLVLDADALTLLGEGRLPSFPGSSAPSRRLLTPHPGEFTRIVEGDYGAYRQDPCAGARMAVRRWEAACLLKGTPSVVAPLGTGPVAVSASGSSDLARAGMGDVLTGTVGALVARGLGGAEAAILGLHLTGRAAARAPVAGESLLPSDVVESLHLALEESGEGRDRLKLPFVLLDLGPPR